MSYDPFKSFGGQDYVEFTTFEGKTVSLHRETWERKIRKHSEQYLAYNFEKIETTLADPDKVIKSKQWDDSLLYYKRFSHFHIRENIETPSRGYPFLMVVVKQGQIVQSVYRVEAISDGVVVWPV